MTRLTHSLRIPAVAAGSPFRRLGELIGHIADTLRTWRVRDRQRRELRELDDATLRDIGLTREQANFAADKPFWRQ